MLSIFPGKKLSVIKTIYLDMDGVIADFDKGYRSIYGCNCRDDPNRNHWTEFVEGGGFANLNLMEDAFDLVKAVTRLQARVEVLSCIGNRGDQNNVARQKREWLIAKGFYFTTNFTFTKKEKSDYALPTSLLIDDSKACIDPFVERGGHAILHENAASTIKQIECMIEKGLICAPSQDQRIWTY